jgi:hypothetical protein
MKGPVRTISLPNFTKTKWFRISAIVAVLIALYALAGFLLAPRLIRNALMQEIPKTLPGIKPTVGEIHFNPFLLQLEINDFSLADAGGEKLLGFGRFFVDFEVSSLWHRAYSFANIDLGKPFVNAVTAKDGQINLAQLSPKSTPPPKTEPKKNESVPALRIGSFKVSDGLVTYDDRAHPSDFAARLEPINFELRDFTTGIDGGKFTFTGTSKLGERVEWHGHVSVQPIESDGEFQIDGLQAHTIWAYLEDRLNFLVNSGSIDLNATYKFALRDAVDLKVDLAKIAVSNLAVRAKDADVDWVSLPQLLVSNTSVDLAKQSVQVDSLTLTGLKLVTWMEADGSLNLMKLAAAPPPAATPDATGPAPVSPAAASAGAAPASTAPAGAAPANTASPATSWNVSLREFALRDASISAEDRATKPAAKVVLAPLSITVADASLDLGKPVHLTLQTKINESGSLNVEGEITPKPLNADLSIKLADIELAVVQPYIAQRTSMTLLSGALSGDTKVHYGTGKPAIDFSGNLSVAKLHTVDNALHDDFVNWDRLDLQGLKYQHDPDRLDIEQVSAQKLYARVMIEPDSTLNVTRVLAGPGATVVAPASPGTDQPPISATAAPAAAPAAKKSRGKRVAKAAAGMPPPAATAAAAPMPMAIKKISLEAGEADFADLSVMPNFSTGIQKLRGSVLGLSSKANSRAKIDLHGQIDEFSPVAITGEANVLGTPLYTDVALSFHNIELSTFNPYSGKFAGYNISKGKLSTDLHYKVDGRKLDAQHHIVVEQLEFGDKTESKAAVSLPIKLAVSLLKNRDGVIELDIPVNGSLDDPQFKLAPIIWKVFVNILEKAVTAPFALLGSLFGGGPDLQFIDFEPGAADLDSGATTKVQTILKALSERPQLKIDVPIAVVESLDRPLLIDAQLKSQLHAAQSAAAAAKKSISATMPFEQLEPPVRLDILSQLYQKNFGAEPKYPDAVTAIKAKPDLTAAKIDYLTGELRGHITVGETELTALGQQRASNLQQVLLQDKQIDPERVFLVANDKAKSEGGKVRLELSLK